MISSAARRWSSSASPARSYRRVGESVRLAAAIPCARRPLHHRTAGMLHYVMCQAATLASARRARTRAAWCPMTDERAACSMKHLPEYIQGASKLREKGVDLIACISVNDAFVMDAWGKSLGAADDIMMLADGSASFAKAMGSDMDLSARNVGTRSRRYSCIIDDLTVRSPEAFIVHGIARRCRGACADVAHRSWLARRCFQEATTGAFVQVQSLFMEDGGAFTVSGVDNILASL